MRKPHPTSVASSIRSGLRRGVILTGVLAIFASVPASARPDWPDDLAFFRRELPSRHKNLFFQIDRATFERAVDTLAGEAPRLTDTDVALRLQEIAVSLGDDHTGVNWQQLPPATSPAVLLVGLQWFGDGWRIVTAEKNRAALLGQKLLAVGDVPMSAVEAKLSRLISDHPAIVKARLPNLLILPAVLRYAGLAPDDHVTLHCATDDGRTSDATYSLRDDASRDRSRLVAFQPKSTALGLKDTRSILWSTLLAEDKIFYAQYNRCDGREVAERTGDKKRAAQLPSLEALFATLRTDLRAAVTSGRADTFVFDVRHNPGGASDFGTRFAQDVATIPELRRAGAVFVIVGRRTFSSAILNATDFQRLCGARMVGETPGGTPNHYGEIKIFVLPSSQLPVSYSTKYFERVPGAGLKPLPLDLAAEATFADYTAGIDAPIEAIRRLVRSGRHASP